MALSTEYVGRIFGPAAPYEVSRVKIAEFADAMEIHNNREVAALFRKMADIETRHAQQIMAQMRWSAMPPTRFIPLRARA